MTELQEIRVGVNPLERFSEVLSREQMHEALHTANRLRHRLSRQVVWNINSTAVGGGVAEMLPPLLGYTRSVGIDSRWLVIRGEPDFFRVTKRLHHALHGSAGDGTPLDDAARECFVERLGRVVTETQTPCYGWALLPNTSIIWFTTTTGEM